MAFLSVHLGTGGARHLPRRQLGRSFELPAFLGLVGIFLAIAVPACQDFLVRKRIASGVEVAASVQRTVSESFERDGPGDMSRLSGRSPPPTEDVASITIARDGTVTVRYTAQAVDPGEDQVQFVPVAGGKPIDLSDPASRGLRLEWDCVGAGGKTTVLQKYLPPACRSPAGPMRASDWLLVIAAGALLLAILGAWLLAIGHFATVVWAFLKRRENLVDAALNTFGFVLMAAVIVGTFAYLARFVLP